jgi:hypothetical protein
VGAFLHGAAVPSKPGLRQVVVDDAWFAGERRPLTTRPAEGFADNQAVCLVALTSGTTGRPKAISLSVSAPAAGDGPLSSDRFCARERLSFARTEQRLGLRRRRMPCLPAARWCSPSARDGPQLIIVPA